MNDAVLSHARWALTFLWFAFFFLLAYLLLAVIVKSLLAALLLFFPGALVFLAIVTLSRVTWF